MTNHIDILVRLFDNCRMVLSYPAGQGNLLLALRARGIPAVSLDPDRVRALHCQQSQLLVWNSDWKAIVGQGAKFDGIHIDLDLLATNETQEFDTLVQTLANGLLPGGLIAMTGAVDTSQLAVHLPAEFLTEHQSDHVTILRRKVPLQVPEPGYMLGSTADVFVDCDHVFEIGTGRGHFLDALKVRDIACSGIEADTDLAAHCRNRGHNVTTGGLDSQRDNQQAYDGIYVGNAFDTLTSGDLAIAFAHCQRLLRIQGRLVLRIKRSEHDSSDVLAQLGTLGFTVQAAKPIPGNDHDLIVAAILNTSANRSSTPAIDIPAANIPAANISAANIPAACAPEIRTTHLPINQPLQGLFDLERFERKINSQGGEDGVLDAIFAHIGTSNRYYVEFGCGDGVQCNTANLHKQGWHGLLMDGMAEPATDDVIIHKEWISRENINDLFAKHAVPEAFDLLSIDIDGNDYWVLEAIAYRPRVIVAEYNANLGPNASCAMPYDSENTWDGSDYYGASLQALVSLLSARNYSLVYCNQAGVNAFFVDSMYLAGEPTRSVETIFRAPNYWYRGYRQVPDLAKVMTKV